MRQSRPQAVACALGVFSIGLGVAELVAPRFVARLAGAPHGHDNLIRLCGVREVANGLGILLAWERGPWLWARVAGDALDLASTRRPAALAALAGVTALDVAAATIVTREENRPPRRRRFDYSGRSGFPRPAAEMRGSARTKKERAQGPLPFDSTTRV